MKWSKIEEILDQALTLPEGERVEFIENLCGNNKQLKGEITTLLESISKSNHWLDNSNLDLEELSGELSGDADLSSDLLIGKKIGDYRVKKLLGEGGMGVVYLAERCDGSFEHKVALKVVRMGNLSNQNIDRFNQERTILAKLNHPGIARLYQGGVSDDQQPYLIMELVDGQPIHTYCDEKRLTIDERVALFQKVLQAVQYGHENLIVHRDLKPENILVTDSGEVKILDYGIAKVIDQSVSAPEDLTITRSPLTPKYAAPEQISELPVTTSIDVYSLGVVLYCMLCGTFPLNFRDKTFFDVQKSILNEIPNSPVQAFSRMDREKQKQISYKRSTTPDRVLSQLKGDIGAIVLKAIEKSPEKRYRSAESFSRDLERCSSGLPVSARAQNLRYRTAKYLQRNRKKLIGSAAAIVLISLMSVFYVTNINRERLIAETEAEKATRIKNFMLELFSSNNPDNANYAGVDLTVSQAMASGIDVVERELSGQPEIYIDMLTAISTTLRNVEDYEHALKAINLAIDETAKQYGKKSSEYSGKLAAKAILMNGLGEHSNAEGLIAESLKIEEELDSSASYDLANRYGVYGTTLAYLNRYREAEKQLIRADSLYLRSDNEQSIARYNSISTLADLYRVLREYDQSEKYLLDALDFYENYYDGPHVNIATNVGKLGKLYYMMSKNELAEEYLLKSLKLNTDLYGEYNKKVAQTHSSLALNYRVMDQLEKAYHHSQTEVRIISENLGEENLNFAHALNNLALIQKSLKMYDEAEKNYRRTIQLKEERQDPMSVSLAVSYYNLADLLHQTGNLKDARNLYQNVVEIDKSTYGDEHAEIAIDLNKLASVERDLGDLDQSRKTFEEARKIFEEKYPKTHHRVGEHHLEVGRLYKQLAQLENAKKHFTRALKIFRENFNEEHSSVIKTKDELASLDLNSRS